MAKSTNSGENFNKSGNAFSSAGKKVPGGSASLAYNVLRKRSCMFCLDPSLILGFRNLELLLRLTSAGGGRILPGRITGICAKDQRYVAREVKKARILAMV